MVERVQATTAQFTVNGRIRNFIHMLNQNGSHRLVEQNDKGKDISSTEAGYHSPASLKIEPGVYVVAFTQYYKTVLPVELPLLVIGPGPATTLVR